MKTMEKELIPIDNPLVMNYLWEGLGQNFENLPQVIFEFADNSISNSIAYTNGKCKITLQVIKLKNENGYRMRMIDNGTGIFDLNKTFKLGTSKRGDTPLNEHGFGIKNALSKANPSNDDWIIMTRTKEDYQKNQYKIIHAPFQCENFYATIIHDEWPSESETGTIIESPCSTSLFNTIKRKLKGNYSRFDTVLQILSQDIGFYYSHIIKQYDLDINIESIETDGTKSCFHVEPLVPNWENDVEPKVIVNNIDLGGGTVELRVQWGFVKKDTTYFRYYQGNMATSGLETRINGRVLEYNQISDVFLVENHPSYNQFICIVDIISDNKDALPSTRTTKSGLSAGDKKLENLYKYIRILIPEIPKKKEKTDIDAVNILQETLNQQYSMKYKLEVIKYSLSSIKVVHVLHDDQLDIYMLKSSNTKASINDIYQLEQYWDTLLLKGINPSKCIFIASGYNEAVYERIEFINNSKKVNDEKYHLEIKTWND